MRKKNTGTHKDIHICKHTYTHTQKIEFGDFFLKRFRGSRFFFRGGLGLRERDRSSFFSKPVGGGGGGGGGAGRTIPLTPPDLSFICPADSMEPCDDDDELGMLAAFQ